MSTTALAVRGRKTAPHGGGTPSAHAASAHAMVLKHFSGNAGHNAGHTANIYSMQDGENVAPASSHLADTIEELAKKLGKKPEELKAMAKEKGFDLDNPEKLKEFEGIAAKGGDLFGAVSSVFGGEKKEATKEAASKPRTKEEAAQALTVRAAIAAGAGVVVGGVVGYLTKNPMWGVGAGAGAFAATAVGYQIASPITSDDLDKIFKEEAKKAASTEKDAKAQTGEQKK